MEDFYDIYEVDCDDGTQGDIILVVKEQVNEALDYCRYAF